MHNSTNFAPSEQAIATEKFRQNVQPFKAIGHRQRNTMRSFTQPRMEIIKITVVSEYTLPRIFCLASWTAERLMSNIGFNYCETIQHRTWSTKQRQLLHKTTSTCKHCSECICNQDNFKYHPFILGQSLALAKGQFEIPRWIRKTEPYIQRAKMLLCRDTSRRLMLLPNFNFNNLHTKIEFIQEQTCFPLLTLSSKAISR